MIAGETTQAEAEMPDSTASGSPLACTVLRQLSMVVLLACAAITLPASASEPPLRVMTFNVRLPLDSDGPNRWEARRDLMAETIREASPDVIGTQELYTRQGDDLVARLPQYTWFGRGRSGDNRDSDEHMGVFYRTDRLRVLASGDFWLSDTPDVTGSMTWDHPLPRMVTWARFERRSDGARFDLYNTHFAHRDEDDLARERSADLILSRVQALSADRAVIVMGDFNTTPGSRAHATLTSVMQDAWVATPHQRGPEATFHDFTGTPDRRIDWILLRGMKASAVRTVTTHRGQRYPSDHFPVVADVVLRATSTAPAAGALDANRP